VAALYGTDPYAAVVRVVQAAGSAVTAADIKRALEAAGVPSPDKRTWERLQKRLRADDQVVVEPGYRYRFVDTPVAASEIDAFESTDGGYDVEAAARRRQSLIDGLRALAELASEVEELAVNEASVRAMVHRVRSRVKLAGLEPIGRAGETTAFDRRRHELIGPPARDGAPVLVIRPGYAWRTPHEDVILARAVVQE
jgi:hypothetical protein